MYLTKSFDIYQNSEINKWMNAAAANGYKLVKMEPCGSSSIIILMEKI